MERKESINKWISRMLMILALTAMMFFVVNLTHSIPGPPAVELEEAEATLGLEAPEDMLALTGGTNDDDDSSSEIDDNDSLMPEIPRPEDHISTLSLESEALLKAKDIMTDDISKFVDNQPSNAAKLIRTWLDTIVCLINADISFFSLSFRGKYFFIILPSLSTFSYFPFTNAATVILVIFAEPDKKCSIVLFSS
jgi:hypothetical protein